MRLFEISTTISHLPNNNDTIFYSNKISFH